VLGVMADAAVRVTVLVVCVKASEEKSKKQRANLIEFTSKKLCVAGLYTEILFHE
jgi:hypothetical protein